MSTPISDLITRSDHLAVAPLPYDGPVFALAAEPLAIAMLTPTLGPSATLCLHHLAVQLGGHNADVMFIPTDDLSRALGGGESRQLLDRALNRLVHFGYAQLYNRELVLIRDRIPPLARRQVEHLPQHLRQAYDALQPPPE